MAVIEPIATNRYRIRSHDQIMTVDAQDILDLMDYGLQHASQLKREAREAQEYQDSRKYMEHYYEGGE